MLPRLRVFATIFTVSKSKTGNWHPRGNVLALKVTAVHEYVTTQCYWLKKCWKQFSANLSKVTESNLLGPQLCLFIHRWYPNHNTVEQRTKIASCLDHFNASGCCFVLDVAISWAPTQLPMRRVVKKINASTIKQRFSQYLGMVLFYRQLVSNCAYISEPVNAWTVDVRSYISFSSEQQLYLLNWKNSGYLISEAPDRCVTNGLNRLVSFANELLQRFSNLICRMDLLNDSTERWKIPW